ncbi:MAG: serine hydrolase [Lachnospirales bacterium]|jgi:D-alanyl-D-alanine carboxypeptidase (penicillin-binding protein 5/6)
MYKRHITIYITIFSIILTTFFSNIYAQPTSVVETTTEATTEEPSVINNYADSSKVLNIDARGAILIDANTGVTIYEKNSHEKLYPASITKIMTAYLACKYGKFDDTLTASHNAIYGIGQGSSIIGIKEGEQISFLDGLYGIMMESANEVCMMVAEHIDGTVEKFVERMNKQAQDWGCKDTHFNNPHGFHDVDHYTTPYDMSLIAFNAIKDENFSKIWGTVDHTIPANNKSPQRFLHNKDKMLKPTSDYYYQYAIGGKTGFHDDAKNTLVTCAEKDGVKLISVVMKANGYNQAYTDSKTLLDYGFSVYKDNKVYTAGTYTDKIPVYQTYLSEDYNVGELNVTVAGDVSAKLPSFVSANDVKTKAVIDYGKDNNANKIYAPIKEGDKVGTMEFTYKDKTIATADITASNSVESKSDKQLAEMKLIKNVKSVLHTILNALIFIIPVVIIIIILLVVRNNINKKKKKKRRKKSGKNSSSKNSTTKRHSSNSSTSSRPRNSSSSRTRSAEELRLQKRRREMQRSMEERRRRSENTDRPPIRRRRQ